MGQTKKRKYDRYTLEYKLQAVKLANSLNVKSSEIADSLGIHPVMLYRWQMEFRRGELEGKKYMGRGKESKKPTEPKAKKISKPKVKKTVSSETSTRKLEDKLSAAELRIKKLEQALECRTEELDLLKKAERFFAKKK